MSEVFQNKKALYHYSPTLFLSVTTRSSAVVSDVTYLDSRSCQNLVGLVTTHSQYTVLFYINVRISLILSDLTFNFAICYEI